MSYLVEKRREMEKAVNEYQKLRREVEEAGKDYKFYGDREKVLEAIENYYEAIFPSAKIREAKR